MANPNRLPSLKHVDMLVLQPRTPPSDMTIVSVPGVQVLLYVQGATVKTGITLPGFTPPGPGPATDVSVYFPGAIVPQAPDGSTGLVARNGSPLYTAQVVSVTQGASPVVRLANNSQTGGITLAAGDRLIVTIPETQWYADPQGLTPQGIGATSNSNGRIRGYVRDYRYDLLIATGVIDAPRIYMDLCGGFVMRG